MADAEIPAERRQRVVTEFFKSTAARVRVQVAPQPAPHHHRRRPFLQFFEDHEQLAHAHPRANRLWRSRIGRPINTIRKLPGVDYSSGEGEDTVDAKPEDLALETAVGVDDHYEDTDGWLINDSIVRARESAELAPRRVVVGPLRLLSDGTLTMANGRPIEAATVSPRGPTLIGVDGLAGAARLFRQYKAVSLTDGGVCPPGSCGGKDDGPLQLVDFTTGRPFICSKDRSDDGAGAKSEAPRSSSSPPTSSSSFASSSSPWAPPGPIASLTTTRSCAAEDPPNREGATGAPFPPSDSLRAARRVAGDTCEKDIEKQTTHTHTTQSF